MSKSTSLLLALDENLIRLVIDLEAHIDEWVTAFQTWFELGLVVDLVCTGKDLDIGLQICVKLLESGFKTSFDLSVRVMSVVKSLELSFDLSSVFLAHRGAQDFNIIGDADRLHISRADLCLVF